MPQRCRTPWTAASTWSEQCSGQIVTSPSSRGPAVSPAPSSGKASTSARSTAIWRRRLPGRPAFGVLAIGGDDPLHQLVADDVLAAEADEGDVLDLAEDVADDDQARALVGRQVDLGDVAGDDHARVEAEPGEEHLHLLGAGVLRLVEDDEGIVKRSYAHERQRRHLDHAALEVAVDPVGVEHVVERVEQRPQVGIDLGLDVAGQEAEATSRPRSITTVSYT